MAGGLPWSMTCRGWTALRRDDAGFDARRLRAEAITAGLAIRDAIEQLASLL